MPTPVANTDLTVINQCLTGFLGEERITDLEDDQTKRAIIMRESYEPTSEFCQTVTNWLFNKTKAALNKLEAEPENRWSAAWQLPNDKLKIITVWPPGRYEIQGKELLSNNTDSIEIDYLRKIEEAFWPAWFTRYVVAELTMRTTRGITGEKANTDQRAERDTAKSEALFNDATQQPNPENPPNAFVDVRL